jgi:hypothetical protein
MPTNTPHTDAGQGHHDEPGAASRKRSSLRLRVLLAVATATAALAALVGSPAAQALIMRDGGICDPIRHMGC